MTSSFPIKLLGSQTVEFEELFELGRSDELDVSNLLLSVIFSHDFLKNLGSYQYSVAFKYLAET